MRRLPVPHSWSWGVGSGLVQPTSRTTTEAAPSANRKSAPHGGALMPVGWAENGALVNARATFRVGRRAGTRKWAYPKAGPKNHTFLSGALCLRCWFRLGLGGFLGLLLRGEFLLDLEGHSINIDTVDLGGSAKCLASVCLGSGS